MMAQIPMAIAIFPKDQFGQFCSASAMLACFCMMINNYGIGKLIDIMKDNYTYIFLYLGISWGLMFIPLIIIARLQRPQKETKIMLNMIGPELEVTEG